MFHQGPLQLVGISKCYHTLEIKELCGSRCRIEIICPTGEKQTKTKD